MEKSMTNSEYKPYFYVVGFLFTARFIFLKMAYYYKIQTKILKNCEHRIPTEGSSLGLEFLKKNLY